MSVCLSVCERKLQLNEEEEAMNLREGKGDYKEEREEDNDVIICNLSYLLTNFIYFVIISFSF